MVAGARLFPTTFALWAACASARPTDIVSSRDLSEASGAPTITDVMDLAGADALITGTLRPGRSDGVAVIGELLWIRGGQLGRQPTVHVGGRPAAVLSRSGDGGILVRVPVRTPVGVVPFVVEQEYGRTQTNITVRRYAALIPSNGNRVSWVDLHPDAPRVGNATNLPGARFVRLSADGRAAYVLEGETGRMHVVELPAPAGPALVGQIDLGPGNAVAFATAAAAHRAVVVRAKDVRVLDTSAPLRPIKGTPVPLPAAVRSADVRRVDLSPDGKRLVVATGAQNRVWLLDLDRLAARSTDPVLAQIAVAPDARAPVINEVVFAPDGQTIWVLVGDTKDSRPLGPQPTEVHAIRITKGAAGIALAIVRTVSLPGATGAIRLTAGRALPLASGAAIRLPPEKATVFVSTAVTGGTAATLACAVWAVGADDQPTRLMNADKTTHIGGADMTPDGRWLLAAAETDGGMFRLLTAPADGRPGVHQTVDLGTSTGGAPSAELVFARADVRAQP